MVAYTGPGAGTHLARKDTWKPICGSPLYEFISLEIDSVTCEECLVPVRHGEQQAANKIATWLEGMGKKMTREHGDKAKHGRHIAETIAGAIRRGEWKCS